MKESICIDTDICIDFLRNREPGSSYFSHALERFQCYISAVTAYELMLGARLMKKAQDVEGFVGNLIVLPFTLETARKSADIFAELRLSQKEIGLPDVFIAATCLVENIPLLTGNKKHYQRVKELKLLD